MRYRIAEIGHLCRTPLGRRQLIVHLYSRAWPFFYGLARLYRRTLVRRTRVVAVVGSYGKTTTSTAIGRTLKLKRINISDKGLSQVAFSVLRMRPGQRHGVMEVAVNRLNQMSRHAQVLRPDVVVITSIGSEHHRSLGTIAAIRDEKAKILAGLAPGGIVIYNGDDAQVGQMAFPFGARRIRFGFNRACDVRAINMVADWPHGTQFTLHINKETHLIRTRCHGREMVYPILAVFAVALAEGRDLAKTIAAVFFATPVEA